MPGRTIGLIGAPSSAGAYAPGQEDAPTALRDAGLLEALTARGLVVEDLGDTPHFRWFPDHDSPHAMHVAAVRATALAVADKVAQALDRDLLPLVVGGDCTVELGTVHGWQHHHEPTTLVYVDPHPDCNTPQSVPDGALDWMGVAHLLGVGGARPELVVLGHAGAAAALAPEDVLLFATSPTRWTAAERTVVEERGLALVHEDDVAADPARAARTALEWTRGRGRFLVHLDVDVVDFADLPLAENTDRNVGLGFETVGAALDVLLADPDLGALTVTELNPHHGAPDGATLWRFAERLAGALSGGAGEGRERSATGP
jgi:arginase